MVAMQEPAGIPAFKVTTARIAPSVVGEGQVARFFSVVAVDRSVRVFTDMGEALEFLGQG